MHSINSNVSAGIFTGESKKYGLIADGNIGAQVFKGEVNYGITLFGASVQSTLGGSLGSAHIGGTAGFYFDNNTGKLNIKLQENFGWGIGEKAAIDIQIPMPFIK